jgi:hypothetical protein
VVNRAELFAIFDKVLLMSDGNAQGLLAQQQRKLWIAAMLIALAVPGAFFPATFSSLFKVGAIWIELASALTFIVALAFTALSSRCRGCRLNLLFYAMSHEHAGNWFAWLLNVKTCPRCGYCHPVETRSGKQGQLS